MTGSALASHPRCLSRVLDRLRADTSGLALMEFALAFPIIMAVGGWGIELSFFSLTNLRVSQYALNLADNASRIGVAAGGVQQLREADINDVLQGTRLESAGIKLASQGRVTLSSLENIQQSYDSAGPVQRIHWQRCLGIMPYDLAAADRTTSTAGSTNTQADKGIDKPNGMGGVKALSGGGVMLVDVQYLYKPAFGGMFVSPQIIHFTASFMVRDNRDFTQIYNFTPKAVAATCDKHNA